MAYVQVAVAGEVRPGEIKAVKANGRKLMLANVDGRYYAADRKCPHLGAPLSFGKLDGNCVVCPLHAAAFDLETGEIRADPKFLFINMKAKRPLKTYSTKVEGEAVLVDV